MCGKRLAIVSRDPGYRRLPARVGAEAFAVVYAGLGDNDRAFGWLEKAYEERACYLPFIKLNPLFNGLRPDPRYRDLLRRMNLPE